MPIEQIACSSASRSCCLATTHGAFVDVLVGQIGQRHDLAHSTANSRFSYSSAISSPAWRRCRTARADRATNQPSKRLPMKPGNSGWRC